MISLCYKEFRYRIFAVQLAYCVLKCDDHGIEFSVVLKKIELLKCLYLQNMKFDPG